MPHRRDSGSSEYVPLSVKILKRHESRGSIPFFSVEFFPPKMKSAIEKIISCFENFQQLGAMFADVTWHSITHADNIFENLSIQVADIALNYCWLNTMLHLTCIGMTEQSLFAILEHVKAIGIRNILTLRGDKKPNQVVTDFHYASDLVKFIRKHYGDYFTIAVAGYPTKHPESPNKRTDLEYLKYKVDCGADFIITQLFFDADVYLKFVEDCRAIGITVPIIPGIMPIQSYDSLEKIARLSQLVIPKKLIQDLEPIKNNDEAVRNYGIDWTLDLCRKIIESKVTAGLHFYTLNRQHATISIVKALNLDNVSCSRPLPWYPSPNHRRCSESVRPIFWASRPKSYICRTNTWDEFPNGRWGNIHSPAFGTLNDHHLFFEHRSKTKKCLQMWGSELTNEKDVWDIFYCYIAGIKNRFGYFVDFIPWNDELKMETNFIIKHLSHLNRNGILTINSQPNINGIDSNDPNFGWGAPNGYVYQKAYVEFFISKERVPTLLKILESYPLVNFQILSHKNDIFYTNCKEDEPIAVTWGVFPGKEIIQPTIVDLVSFKVWKDEAFSLWKDKWATIYPENSNSRNVLENIHDNYCLANLVDNQFPRETCLWNILDQTILESSVNISD